MLIGNKADIVNEDPSLRKVSIEEATEHSKKHNLLFMETSAKTGHNVKEAFEYLVESKNFVKFEILSCVSRANETWR